MVAGTHIAFASALYIGGAAVFEYDANLWTWALAAVASLLPDIDLPTSRLGRAFFWLSSRLERDYGHRTITHSFIAMLALSVALSPLLWLHLDLWYWSFLGGYWSHLWIDMVNIRGADLLWPSPARLVFPGNRKYRLETGSKGEMVLSVALVAFTLLLYPVSGVGLRASLQQWLGNFDMALDRFTKEAGSQWFTLDLDAIDNLTLEHVECNCQVLGLWNGGLIVDYGGHPRAVGESQTAHNLFPKDAKLMDGPKLNVVSEHVDMKGRSLRWLLEHIDKSRTYFLLGQMLIGGGRFEDLQQLDLYHHPFQGANSLKF
jgi:inner membrane protein